MSIAACLECQKSLTLYERLRYGYFCSAAHEEDYLREIDACGIVRLAQARARMGIDSSTERFAAALAAPVSRYDSAERRKDAGIALDEPVRVTLLDEGSATLCGRFVNVSATGLKITAPQTLNLGATVKVECGRHAIVGEVRACQASLAGFAIGIVISRWSESSDSAWQSATVEDLGSSGLILAVVE